MGGLRQQVVAFPLVLVGEGDWRLQVLVQGLVVSAVKQEEFYHCVVFPLESQMQGCVAKRSEAHVHLSTELFK